MFVCLDVEVRRLLLGFKSRLCLKFSETKLVFLGSETRVLEMEVQQTGFMVMTEMSHTFCMKLFELVQIWHYCCLILGFKLTNFMFAK